MWNLSYGRSLPKGMYFEASYIGRSARNLLAAQDVAALNNLVDPQSGMDWYQAANLLVDAQKAGVPITSLGPIPYFENLFPTAMAALGVFGLPANNNTQAIYGLFADDGFGIRDYTFIQLIIDDATAFGLPVNPGIFPNMFYHPQYAAFSSFGTTANPIITADIHIATETWELRCPMILTTPFQNRWIMLPDFQTGASYGSQFILNPLRPDDNYSLSDFDAKHVVKCELSFPDFRSER